MDLLNYQYLDKMNNNIGILCYEGRDPALEIALLWLSREGHSSRRVLSAFCAFCSLSWDFQGALKGEKGPRAVPRFQSLLLVTEPSGVQWWRLGVGRR